MIHGNEKDIYIYYIIQMNMPIDNVNNKPAPEIHFHSHQRNPQVMEGFQPETQLASSVVYFVNDT